jgi:hypothetical protein
MEEKLPIAYFVAVDSEDTQVVEEILKSLGDCIQLTPGFYLLASVEPKGKIIFSLDPLGIDSLKRYFLVQSTDVIWNVFEPHKESIVQGILKRCKL